jgi:hypothetical protein
VSGHATAGVDFRRSLSVGCPHVSPVALPTLAPAPDEPRRSQYPGVETVVVMIGINDIGWPGGVLSPTDPPVSVDDLIMGVKILA